MVTIVFFQYCSVSYLFFSIILPNYYQIFNCYNNYLMRIFVLYKIFFIDLIMIDFCFYSYPPSGQLSAGWTNV